MLTIWKVLQSPLQRQHPSTNSLSPLQMQTQTRLMLCTTVAHHLYLFLTSSSKLWISSCEPGPFHIAIHASESGLRQSIQPILSSIYTYQRRVSWSVRTHTARIPITVLVILAILCADDASCFLGPWTPSCIVSSAHDVSSSVIVDDEPAAIARFFELRFCCDSR